MSSNIRVTRICQHCGNEFVARTTVTKFCQDTCAKKAYKAAIRNSKIKKSNEEVVVVKSKPLESIKTKDYLTVIDAATLLSCSIRAVYNMIDDGRINATNLSARKTRIRREEIDKLFELPTIPIKEKAKVKNVKFKVEDFYSVTEAEQKAGMSNKAFFEFLKREGIAKIQKGKFVYVPKKIIDQIFKPVSII
jgi:excisionase family DNA binding protein